jgi:5-methylcytosine-specific restriction endonuclease McrA
LLSASYKPLRQPVWPTGTIKTRLIHVVGKELWYPYYTLWNYVGHELSPMTTHRIKKMIPSLRLELERCQRKEILKARLAAADNRTRGLAKKIKDDLRKQLSHLAECPYCGNHIGDSPEADHIYPVASGGLSTPENLVYVCKSCNSKKSSLTLSMFVRKMGFDRNLIESRLDRLGKRY